MKQQNNLKDAAKQSLNKQVVARQQNKDLTTIEKPKEYLLGLMDKSEKQFLRLLSNDKQAVSRLVRVTMNYISKNEKLLECYPNSVIGCMLLSAELGLEFGYLGQAHMVPFFNKNTKRLEAQFIPGYQGLNLLAQRTGDITAMYADVVYEGDDFNYEYGINAGLSHKPNLEMDRSKGKKRCVYAYAKTKSGFYFTVLSMFDVQKIRAYSKAPDSPAWKEWTDEMYVKTAYRKLSKLLPKESSIEHMKLWKAATLDEAAAAGLPQHLDPNAFDDLGGIKVDPDKIYQDAEVVETTDDQLIEKAEKVKSIAEHITGKEDYSDIEQLHTPSFHITNIENLEDPAGVDKYLFENAQFIDTFNDANRKLINTVAKTQQMKLENKG